MTGGSSSSIAGPLAWEAGGRNAMRNLDGWLNPHPAVARATAAKNKSAFVRTSINASNSRTIRYFREPIPARNLRDYNESLCKATVKDKESRWPEGCALGPAQRRDRYSSSSSSPDLAALA